MIKSKKRHWAEWFIGIIAIFPVINYYLSEILTTLSMSTYGNYFYILIYSVAIFAYMYLIKKMNVRCIIATLIVGLVYFLTVLATPEVMPIIIKDNFAMSYFIVFWASIFPVFLLTLTKIDIEVLTKIMYNLSKLASALIVFSFAVRTIIFSRPLTSYMSFAYEGLLPVMLCTYFGQKKKEPIFFILGLAACICIIIAGCRGAAVTLISFLVVSALLKTNKTNQRTRFILYIVIGAAAIIVAFNLENIASWLNDLLLSLNFKSRTLALFLSGDFFNDSGRTVIQNDIFAGSGILPRGLYGDMVLAGTYAHNWIIEFLCDFGYMIGSILVLTIIMFLLKAVIKMRKANNEKFFWAIAAVCIIMLKYLFSSSFLLSFDFLFLLGMIINLLYIDPKTYQVRTHISKTERSDLI